MLSKNKLLLLLFAVILLAVLYLNLPTDLVKALEIENAEVFIYCRQSSFDSALNIGNMVVVKTSPADFELAKKSSAGIDGISLRFDGDFDDIEKILQKLDVSVVMSQNLGDIVCIYGYSSKLQQGVVANGHKINVQISYNGNDIQVGYPLILGSY